MTTQERTPEASEAFMGRLFADFTGAAATVMGILGDRLGLFKALARTGAVTSDELAQRAGITERYAREWLSAMTSAGYVGYDAAAQRFALPPEHVPVLAEEDGPLFFGGFFQLLAGMLHPLDQLTSACRQGGGVPLAAYPEDAWVGAERATAPVFEHQLVQQWLQAVPAVQVALTEGIHVADLGCGHGRALVKLAQAFPRSTFVGYDISPEALGVARERAVAAGVGERIRFEQRDISQGLPEAYALVTAFDVLHDLADPVAALQVIRRVLTGDGTFLLLEFASAETLAGNAGPIGTVGYSISMLYCLTTSLAIGGLGLGTLGLPESRVRQMCAEAGFSAVERLPLALPFNVLYAIKP